MLHRPARTRLRILTGATVISVLVVACTAARVCAEDARAPTSQPVLLAGAPSGRAIQVNELSLELGFEADGSRRSVRTDPQSIFDAATYRQRNETRRFQETLGLTTSGNIVDERVLRYDAMARWGLSQETYQESRPGIDVEKNPHGELLEYDVHALALPVGKVSVDSFASRLRDRIPRPFLPSLDRTRERYGGQVTLNDSNLPMSLTFEHLWDDIGADRTFFNEDNEQRGQDSLRYEATWQATANHALKLNYEYQDRQEQFSGTRDTFNNRRNYLSLLDTIQFGDQGRNRLETLLRWEDEEGDWARDAAEFSPRLHLQHADNLFSTYSVSWLKDSFQSLKAKTLRADAGITHVLAEALTSNLNVYGLRQDNDENADLGEWGTLANFNYSKENPLGRFSSNLSYNHTDTQTNDGDRDGAAIFESVTFRDPLPAYLAHANIDRWSIVVTDVGRTRLYLFGRDYIILPTLRATALKRVPTGQIADRQTVLVSYVYRVYENYGLRRDRVDYRIQQDFKNGWTPYYAGTLQQEDLNTRRYLLWDDRNIDRQRLGLTYRQKRWSIGGEYEYNDDSVDPYDAFHANADAAILQQAQHQLNARATFSYFDFAGRHELESRHTQLLDLGLDYRAVLMRNLEAIATAAYRHEDDSLFGRTNGVDLRGSLAYRWGLFTVFFEVEYETLHLPSSEDDSFGFWIRVKREIPVIGRARS